MWNDELMDIEERMLEYLGKNGGIWKEEFMDVQAKYEGYERKNWGT